MNKEIEDLYQKLNNEAEESGYHLNPDIEFTKELVESLLINQKRYNYWACPCRLASGNRAKDLNIICPCIYRDPDIEEYSTCFCGLYVSKKVIKGEESVKPIPDRKNKKLASQKNIPIHRCTVCGYLCAREHPPETCPICKADKDRFTLLN